ncbi:BrxA family protein [Clostridium sp.]|nr:BrxA family protein [Clostridium sp.]
MTTRLNELDEFVIDRISEGNVEISKILVLYAIIKTDRLFY